MKGQSQGHLDFKHYIKECKKDLFLHSLILSHKGAELSPMLLLIIIRKPYMASPMTSSPLTLSDPERSSQVHSDVKALYLVMEPS